MSGCKKRIRASVGGIAGAGPFVLVLTPSSRRDLRTAQGCASTPSSSVIVNTISPPSSLHETKTGQSRRPVLSFHSVSFEYLGIYQSGLLRALPSCDRHLKSPDFSAHFNMRGRAMPDMCALLSMFIPHLPTLLLNPRNYSAFWHWSVKPSVNRKDARRNRHKEVEEHRACGEPLSVDEAHRSLSGQL